MALSWLSITLIAVLLASAYVRNRVRVQSSSISRDAETEEPDYLDLDTTLPQHVRRLRSKLQAALPHAILLPDNRDTFRSAVNSYWDKKVCGAVPAFVVRPLNVWELSTAVKIVKREFDVQVKNNAARSGFMFGIGVHGHSPVDGASSAEKGVLIDMGFFSQVTPSADRKTVVIGMGCNWVEVYNELQRHRLAIAGGRNHAVGVGGFILGGGISFLSPKVGFACSNVTEYEVVLADGTVSNVTETSDPHLWRALKGGSNNYCIVTNIRVRCFPTTQTWSGIIYVPSFETSRTLIAFHEFANRIISKDPGTAYDSNAAGPVTCFRYMHQYGITAIAINPVYTDAPRYISQWPECWRNSGFAKLWRLWSTCKSQTTVSATREIARFNKPGRRQEFATTTIKNDLDTLRAAHKAYKDAIVKIRKHKIEKMEWTLVLQPLLPDWARKGDPNPLGLSTGPGDPLVIVSFTINWALSERDAIVQQIAREAIEQIDAFAERNKTGHRYRYFNHCGKWQKPFGGYGEGELEFLREVSRRVDPDGLFQRGFAGAFKLGLEYEP